MKKKKFKAITVILVTTSPTIIFCLFFSIKTMFFLNDAILVEGFIQGKKEKVAYKKTYSYNIQYKDINNKEYLFKTKFINEDKLNIGDTVELYYNPKNNQDVKLNTFSSLFSEALTVFAIGGSFFIITLILVM